MIDKTRLPKHIAIIMDGNGRWAKERGLPRIAGHKVGVETVRKVLEAARDIGIKMMTLYAFSTENWKRSKSEIDGLFNLLEIYLDNEGYKFDRDDIRFNVIGDISPIPERLRAKLEATMARTKNYSTFTLNLALNYGSRREILEAARAIAKEAVSGRIDPDDIDEKTFSDHLYTKGLTDPDLLIRTSGEKRVSNFLLWQISYAEIYITDKYWPDFSEKDLEAAILDFQKRDRRFGA